jgi:hypothetical protein
VHGRAVGEVTNSGNSDPNASNPNGPATCRGASPTRILGAPARSPGRRRARPRSPWLGGREQLGPRRPRELPSGECGKDRAHFSLQRGRGRQYAQRRLTQTERVREFSAPVPVASGCAMWGSGVRSQVSLCRPSTRLRRGRVNSVRPTSAPALTTTQPARPQGPR